MLSLNIPKGEQRESGRIVQFDRWTIAQFDTIVGPLKDYVGTSAKIASKNKGVVYTKINNGSELHQLWDTSDNDAHKTEPKLENKE